MIYDLRTYTGPAENESGSYGHLMTTNRFLFTQEWIPVGCVPPALYRRGRGCLGRGVLSRGVSLSGGPLYREVSVQGHPPGHRPPAPRGQTDACENITLPQTSFAGGNKSFTAIMSV